MEKYTLNLTIDPASLGILWQAQMKITIAKSVAGASPNVAWLVFDPYQGNEVTWEETYGIYASPETRIQNGATITRLNELYPAVSGVYYNFLSSMNFSEPQSGSGAPPQGTYQVNNRMPAASFPALTFGLQQRASINGGDFGPSPINVAVVPASLTAQFTPLTRVVVWVQAYYASGTMITQINGDATAVTFGGRTNEHNLKWNGNYGRFIPTGSRGWS